MSEDRPDTPYTWAGDKMNELRSLWKGKAEALTQENKRLKDRVKVLEERNQALIHDLDEQLQLTLLLRSRVKMGYELCMRVVRRTDDFLNDLEERRQDAENSSRRFGSPRG